MNSSNIDLDDDVMDGDNDIPHQILLVNMIERGNLIHTNQLEYFIQHFSSCNPKTKTILQDNFVALIATLAYDNVSTNFERQREMVIFQHMAISIDHILANYKMKDIAQDKVMIMLFLIIIIFNCI